MGAFAGPRGTPYASGTLGGRLGHRSAAVNEAERNLNLEDRAGTFTYWGEGTADDPCGTPANTRLYFNTANGPFAYTKYWWSNPAAAFRTAPDTGTVTATVEPAEWSDWNGQNGTTDPAAFADAASNPDLLGLSFGGGCFFEKRRGHGPRLSDVQARQLHGELAPAVGERRRDAPLALEAVRNCARH